MKIPNLWKKASPLSIVMTVASVFLGVVLLYSAIVQFIAGKWFSGGVSLLGVLLIIGAAVMVLLDLAHKKKEKQD